MANSASSSIRKSAAATDRNPVYREAVNDLRTLRTTIEQSTGKWSLTKEKSVNTVNHKTK
ncbi:hypothetical protein EDF70_102168 [Neorhizobium sp. JUb45]|nr:hypothetical protein EDF70_102168 [Neorhizobium sp. JUb45]